LPLHWSVMRAREGRVQQQWNHHRLHARDACARGPGEAV
jgi:hypothetical protein